MNIKYFFIASAVTSGLALALQESNRIVNQQPSSIVVPYTVDTTTSQFIKPISGTTNISILSLQSKGVEKQREMEDLYRKGKNLFYDIIGFIYSLMKFSIKHF